MCSPVAAPTDTSGVSIFFFNLGKPRLLGGACTCFGSQSKQVGELTPGVSSVGISESLSLSIHALGSSSSLLEVETDSLNGESQRNWTLLTREPSGAVDSLAQFLEL